LLLFFFKCEVCFNLDKIKKEFNQIKLKEKNLTLKFKGLLKKKDLSDKVSNAGDHLILIKLRLDNFFRSQIVFKKKFPFFIRFENFINSRFLLKDDFFIIKNLFLFENFVLKENEKRQKYKERRL